MFNRHSMYILRRFTARHDDGSSAYRLWYQRGVVAFAEKMADVFVNWTLKDVAHNWMWYKDHVEARRRVGRMLTNYAAKRRAVRIIQARFLKCYYDPRHPVCQRRLRREFEEMNLDALSIQRR
jgi:hypothetical protein